jgi:hypothetical protein
MAVVKGMVAVWLSITGHSETRHAYHMSPPPQTSYVMLTEVSISLKA